MKDPNMRKMFPSCPFFALFGAEDDRPLFFPPRFRSAAELPLATGEERTSCPLPAL